MTRKPGRPPADEVSEGAAKQVMDAKKITTTDETASLLDRANAMLEQTAKTTLLNTAVTSAKKAELISKRELLELQEEDKQPGNGSTPKMAGGMSVDDIRTIAETLPEPNREAFIRQALGMQTAMSGGNPMMNAWFQNKTAQPHQPQQTTDTPPMTLSDTIQAMMGMMMMQSQINQQKSDSWREQQEFEEKAHQRRMLEIREAKGDTTAPATNPEIEALKLQMEFYRETIKENQALIKEFATTKPNAGDSDLRTEIMALTKKNLEDQKLALDEKVRTLEGRLADASRFNLNVHEMVKQANEAGANLRVGDTTDVQLANEHEFRMEQLKQQALREQRDHEQAIASASAQAEAAKAQQDAIKMILTEVGGAIVQSKMAPAKSLSESSSNVRSIVGA